MLEDAPGVRQQISDNLRWIEQGHESTRRR